MSSAVWADGLDGVRSLMAFQDAVIELRRSIIVIDGLSAVKESELVQLPHNFPLFITLHCEMTSRTPTDEYSITGGSNGPFAF